MTYRQVFADACSRLAAASHPTETPELDARVLLGQAADLSHASLLTRWNEAVDPVTVERFDRNLTRRLEGEPVAWISGTKEFMGLEFKTPPGVLVPRADTETLVEAALEVLRTLSVGIETPEPLLKVADVCTGTGCVAVGIAALFSGPLEVSAGDLSPLAVAAAKRNAAKLLPPDRTVAVLESDLLERLSGPWDLIVSNPPYLTTEETRERIENLGWKEPALALDGGADGLELPRRLVVQAAERLVSSGWLLMEAAGGQMENLWDFFAQQGFDSMRTWKDLAGIERVIGGQLRERSDRKR